MLRKGMRIATGITTEKNMSEEIWLILQDHQVLGAYETLELAKSELRKMAKIRDFVVLGIEAYKDGATLYVESHLLHDFWDCNPEEAKKRDEIAKKRNLLSDFHKDVYGFRPRYSHDLDDAEVMSEWDRISWYFQEMKSTVEGRERLRREGWQV